MLAKAVGLRLHYVSHRDLGAKNERWRRLLGFVYIMSAFVASNNGKKTKIGDDRWAVIICNSSFVFDCKIVLKL